MSLLHLGPCNGDARADAVATAHYGGSQAKFRLMLMSQDSQLLIRWEETRWEVVAAGIHLVALKRVIVCKYKVY